MVIIQRKMESKKLNGLPFEHCIICLRKVKGEVRTGSKEEPGFVKRAPKAITAAPGFKFNLNEILRMMENLLDKKNGSEVHVVTLTAGNSAEINGVGVNASSTVCVKCAEMVGAFGMLMSLFKYQMRGLGEVYQGARKGNDNLPGPSQKSCATPQGMESSESIETCAQTGGGSHPDLQSVGGYVTETGMQIFFIKYILNLART